MTYIQYIGDLKYVELNELAHVLNKLVKQDERELKREKRKQSNRESAKRSRAKKQVRLVLSIFIGDLRREGK